jgi:RNA polymerase sigma-70 factor (ECF subfamily)
VDVADTGETFERLLENARWVRALGIELVGSGEADDLVQAALGAALAGGARAENPGAWLSGVLRRLAGRGRRGSERRLSRERAAARAEALPAADELVLEAELSRTLIRAVTELEEPFRTTVLLRYYRGLESAAIAAAQGVAPATVRTRLHRAHGLLRAKLDREQGGRAAWALAFAVPGNSGAATLAASTVGGGIGMGAKAALGAVAVLAALVGGVWSGARERAALAEASPDAVLGERVTVRATPRSKGAESSTARPPEREALAAEARASARFPEVLLFGAARDESGAELTLESVTLEGERGETWSASRQGQGSYSIAAAPAGAYTLIARADGHLTHEERLLLDGSREHVRHDLVLARGLAIPVRILDETGAPVRRLNAALGFELDVALARGPELARAREERRIESYGLGRFLSAEGQSDIAVPSGASGLLVLSALPPVHVFAVFEELVLATERIDGPREELVLRIDLDALAGRLGTVRARFVDAERGTAVADGMAAIDWGNRQTMGGAPLTASGSIELTDVPPGLQRLRFFHAEYAELFRPLRVPVGGVLELGDVAVWRRARVGGMVFGADGAPILAHVSWTPAGEELRADRASSTRGGRFELPQAARTRLRLLVRAPEHVPCVFEVDASGGDVAGLELHLERGVPVAFRGARGRVLTWLDAAGGSIPLGSDERLPPGRHSVRVGAEGEPGLVIDVEVGSEPLRVDLPEER